MRTGESNYYNIPSKSHLAGSIIRIRQGKQKSANGQLPSVSRLYFQSAGISVHLFQATQHTIHTYRSSTKESGGPVLSLPRGHYRCLLYTSRQKRGSVCRTPVLLPPAGQITLFHHKAGEIVAQKFFQFLGTHFYFKTSVFKESDISGFFAHDNHISIAHPTESQSSPMPQSHTSGNIPAIGDRKNTTGG